MTRRIVALADAGLAERAWQQKVQSGAIINHICSICSSLAPISQLDIAQLFSRSLSAGSHLLRLHSHKQTNHLSQLSSRRSYNNNPIYKFFNKKSEQCLSTRCEASQTRPLSRFKTSSLADSISISVRRECRELSRSWHPAKKFAQRVAPGTRKRKVTAEHL